MALSLGSVPAFATIAEGLALWQTHCDGCHGVTPSGGRVNASNRSAIITTAISAVLGMNKFKSSTIEATSGTSPLTSTDRSNLALYLEDFFNTSPIARNITYNTTTNIPLTSYAVLGTSTTNLTTFVTVTAPTKGAVTWDQVTETASYNPNANAIGTDFFTYRVRNAADTITTSTRTINITIVTAAPSITSSATKTATVGQVMSNYTITVTAGSTIQVPTSYGATPRPTGISIASNVISGTPTTATAAGVPFNTTISATNAGGTDSQTLAFTILKGSQTITFTSTNLRTFVAGGAGMFTETATASIPNSGSAITFTASPGSVCTSAGVNGATITMVGGGSCTVTANMLGNANYNAASATPHVVTISPATQTMSFPLQTTPINFNGGTFALSPATATSGLAVSYAIFGTPTVCSISSPTTPTVTMLTSGTCTIRASQAGNASFSAAPAVPDRSVVINAVVPAAPTIGLATSGDAQASIAFSPPGNSGGVVIIDYTVTCTGPNTKSATGTASPIIVTTMTNGSSYSCTAKARNSIGSSAASAAVNVTPANTPVAPAFTSANATTFTVGVAGVGPGSFNVTATGFPTPTFSKTGALPSGVTLGSNGLLSGTPALGTAGSYPITITATGTAPAANQSFTLTVAKAAQSLAFTPPANQEFSPVPIPLSASATLAPVSFATSTPTFCSVAGATFSTLQLGTCTLIANQAGNADYAPISSAKVDVSVVQGSQTITFQPQLAQTFVPAAVFALTPAASASSGLPIVYGAPTPGVCALGDKFVPQVTIVSAGTCTIEANQDGNTNYLPASLAAQDIVINMAAQTISWGAPSAQPFGTGGTFAISPLASGGASGNAVVYSSATSGVCTVSGTTVTKVATGTCTLNANQSGNGNYSAATQVQRSLSITASVPTAPVATQITPSDSQVVIEFNSAANNGGSPITGYRATCSPGGAFANGATSPITVMGLTNTTAYTCSVVAQNAAGSSPPSNTLMATPILATGVALWTNACSACHNATPSGVRLNAAGTTGTVINYVRSVQPVMQMQADVQALTLNELAEIAKYIDTFVPNIAAPTPFNTAAIIDVSSHLTPGGVAFDGAEVVDQPLHGMLSTFNGTQITYTPTAGYVGADSFTYRGFHTTPVVKGDKRAVSITVGAPPAPVVTSPVIAAGTFATPFVYQITATNSPTSYGAAPLGGNFSIDTSTGSISGTPITTGTFMLTVSATNAGGTGMQVVDVTISKASQLISFGAQSGQSFSLGGSFALNPVATSSSNLPISTSSLTPSICTISGTTVGILMAGTCVIAADQSGNANFEAALQVTRNIAISATFPGAPTIGTATPGDTVAAIGFTPPSSNGGSAITSYSASCTPSGSGGSTVSPIMVSGLSNGVNYTCSVTATNAAGTGAASGTVMVTPAATPVAPQLTSAAATTFTVGVPGTFTVTATGTPPPTRGLSGTLPGGVSFSGVTGILAGTPTPGTVGSYVLSITATNATMPAAMQTFTLTVAKANQTISFTGPASQPFTTSPINLTATATSSLAVSLTSNTPSVCTVSVATLSLITVGTCSITASQAGDTNTNAAMSVTQGFTVSQATQTISFATQTPANRSFVAGATFAINPAASASSGLSVIYSATTPGICTVLGVTVTMVAPGTCTIAANQSGSATYSAAPQATQAISLNATVPGAPTIGTASGGNAQATINFSVPGSNGGSAISSYRATCNPGNIFADGSASPIVVSGLANNVVHNCAVTATNGVGTGAPSATVAVTPLSGQGAALWAQVCDACHTTVPSGNQLNGAGTTATVINYVRATQPTMAGTSANALAVQALSTADLADIATYIASVISPNLVATSVNTAVLVDVHNHITLTNQAWSAFTAIEIVSGPAHGSLGTFSGTQIQYTPAAGYMGADSFTYRGKRTVTSVYDGDPQTVTISVNPPTPVITSATNASGTLGQAFSYQITATDSPTSFTADGLPGGLSVNATGLISGIPSEAGQFNVAISAINAGGTGDATLTLQINQIPQVINFGAQSTPRTFSAGGTFAITPLATGGASLNAIIYGSSTPGVCTVSGTTVSMVAAGICTITADQPGNATYAAAIQATQNVTIDPGPQLVTVTINGTGNVTGTGFNCPGDCTETVAQNSVIALTAAASSGSTFTGWSGTCGGTPAGFTYSTSPITTNCSVIATFVQAASSTTTLGSSLNPSNVGQAVTLTATVTGGVGTPTGAVAFLDGINVIAACASVTVSGGIAQCTTTSLSSGVRSITAQYSGNSVYNASTSGALSQTVKGTSLEAVIYLMLD